MLRSGSCQHTSGFTSLWCCAGALGELVQRAARTGREAGAVQEDARAVDEAGPVVVLVDLDPDALLLRPLAELPRVVVEQLRRLVHERLVLRPGGVGTVGAAAVHELGRFLGEHALAAVAEDAGPVRREKGDVHVPDVLLALRVLERDPLPHRTRCLRHATKCSGNRR